MSDLPPLPMSEVQRLMQLADDYANATAASSDIERGIAERRALEAALREALAETERLRASLGAIHHRVCRGASSHGMGEAIASECEARIPELLALRP